MSDDVAGPPRYTTTTLKNLLEQHDLQMPVARLRDGETKKDGSWEDSFDSTAAFLSPNLWDKSITYQDEFKMEYVDLDDFFSENGISVPTSNTTTDLANMKPAPPQQQHQHHQPHHHLQHHQPTQSQGASAPPVEKPAAQPAVHSPPLPAPPVLPSPPSQQSLPPFEKALEIKSEPLPSPSSDGDMLFPVSNSASNRLQSLASHPGHDSFDPQSHTFSEEELKPQPMVKKSRKQFVPDDLKDDRYWARRRKNNLAAKRSRDARRVKENQIALRASFLEKENLTLRKEMELMRKENSTLKDTIAKLKSC